jgi:nickel-dependent lactate racemase
MNTAPKPIARSFPTVDLPQPDTPMTTIWTMQRSSLQSAATITQWILGVKSIKWKDARMVHVPPKNLIGLPMGEKSLIGGSVGVLEPTEISAFISQAIESIDIHKKRVLLVVPDSTRSCPLPILLPEIYQALDGKVSSMTALIALGTHAPMTDAEIDIFFAGKSTVREKYPRLPFVNHAWWEPDQFVEIGEISEAQVREISNGRMDNRVKVIINRLVVESDVVIIVGPVFPHEVVGFSGGAKYLFPGVSGKEIIDASHWLGALITSSQIIGTPGITPVREMINVAASKINTDLFALCLVVKSGAAEIEAISFGKPHSAWELASSISSQTHINYLKQPVKRVLSIIPDRYRDIWTAAKGMYKVDPIVEDGGEVILYAPHVKEFALSHPELDEIGYHCRAFFTEQWDRYQRYSAGVLAHATHLRGAGTYSAAEGEKCRITVTLATGITEPRVKAANLNYLDPNKIDIDNFKKDGETFVVPNAGEILYRIGH